MLPLFPIYAAIALNSYVVASPTPFSQSLRPRFLREAGSLPPRGIMEDGVVTIPLRRHASIKPQMKKRQSSAQVPLGDSNDNAYGVALDIGGEELTFQLDTGSSDLWSITSDCKSDTGATCTNTTGIPTYKQGSSFQSLDLPVVINYGGSTSATYASGTIGSDNVTFAGLSQSQQPFASMNSTNNSIADSFSGIFGVSFPYISNVANAFAAKEIGNNTSIDAQTFLSSYFAAMEKSAPLLIRLANAGQLKAPMYTLSMQREIPTSDGSNAGVMTLGGLPSGISNDSLTWVPVKTYPGSLAVLGNYNGQISPSIANDIDQILPSAPYIWEAAIDGLYIEGQLQENSSVNKTITNQYGLNGLFDSGTTDTLLTTNDLKSPQLAHVKVDPNTGLVPCDTLINLAVGIGGKQFPINPLDLIGPNEFNDSTNCIIGIGPNDPPTITATESYVFGDAFFRSNLVAFYWGNITDQASDPARIGFLSTVNVDKADAAFSSFWGPIAASSTTFTFSSTDGVPKATTTSVSNPINSVAGVAAASGGVGNSSGAKSAGVPNMRASAMGGTTAVISIVVACLLIG